MLLKKIVIAGPSILLTIGIVTTSNAYPHARHVWTTWHGGVCHNTSPIINNAGEVLSRVEGIIIDGTITGVDK